MRAIILAAGYGGRMRPLSDRVHKALLPITDHTILGRILDALADNGVDEIAIVTGYKSDEIRAYVAEHFPRATVQFVHNERYAETNNIFSLSLAFEQVPLDQPVLIIESDVIVDPSLIKQLIDSRYPNVALVDRFRFGMEGTVVSVEGDVVTQVIPPHLQSNNFDYTDKYKTLNLYKFSAHFSSSIFRGLLTFYAKTLDDRCYYELILGILVYMQREKVHAEIVKTQDWAEVDTPNELEAASFLFNRESRLDLLDRSNGGFWVYDVLDFHFIRNMHFPTGDLMSALRTNLPHLLHNYGSNQRVLNRKLSYALLVHEERLQVLHGASQVYPILRHLLGGRRALVPSPTFGEYPRNFNVTSTYADAVGVDLDEVEQKLSNADMAVFVNPNNPTGTTLPTDTIYQFAGRHPGKTFLVDESFIEFSEQPSIIDRLESEPLTNVVVLKSLSKTLGVPGLRLGYVYACDTDLIAAIGASIPIWNMNSMAEFFIESLLKYRPELAESYQKTKSDRAEFVALLSELPCVEKVYPSGGNFLMLRLRDSSPDGAARLTRDLLTRSSIYVKDVSPRFSDGGGYLRLAVRTPIENRQLLAKLEASAARTHAGEIA